MHHQKGNYRNKFCAALAYTDDLVPLDKYAIVIKLFTSYFYNPTFNYYTITLYQNKIYYSCGLNIFLKSIQKVVLNHSKYWM